MAALQGPRAIVAGFQTGGLGTSFVFVFHHSDIGNGGRTLGRRLLHVI